MACLAATGKEEKKAGGLVHAVALDPPDPGRLLYDGGDEGLDPRQVSILRQGPENVGEPDVGVAEDDLHQHLLKGPGDGLPRLVGQLLRKRRPEVLERLHHALEEGRRWSAGFRCPRSLLIKGRSGGTTASL